MIHTARVVLSCLGTLSFPAGDQDLCVGGVRRQWNLASGLLLHPQEQVCNSSHLPASAVTMVLRSPNSRWLWSLSAMAMAPPASENHPTGVLTCFQRCGPSTPAVAWPRLLVLASTRAEKVGEGGGRDNSSLVLSCLIFRSRERQGRWGAEGEAGVWQGPAYCLMPVAEPPARISAPLRTLWQVLCLKAQGPAHPWE